MTADITAKDVLDFWLVETEPAKWFEKNAAFDQEIARRFGATVEAALAGQLDGWAQDEAGSLGLILVLDQFTRNIFRDTPRAFAGDKQGLALSQRCHERGYLANADVNWRHFMLMPMMHSEDIAVQDASLPLFRQFAGENTYDYAVKHRDIIARFGRFPHRNAILGRVSTPEEVAFLTQPGSSF